MKTKRILLLRKQKSMGSKKMEMMQIMRRVKKIVGPAREPQMMKAMRMMRLPRTIYINVSVQTI